METEKTVEATANRVRYMETLYEDALSFLKRGQWLEDYELDSAGLLPKELKRGVLSQDGLYNLLTDWNARFPQK